MATNEKPGGGGKDQPYIAKGHGNKSGQYCKKQASDYASSEHCTAEELTALLTSEELYYVERYSNYEFGIPLNKAIREGRMTRTDEIFKNNVVSAIGKHKLENPLTVFRGISVKRKVYLRNFVLNYILDEPIVGSTICSTSRKFSRAVAGAHTDDAGSVGILFEIDLPKGHKALPIESVASDITEEEILLSSPRYLIDDMETREAGGYHYVWIKVKLLGDRDNEN